MQKFLPEYEPKPAVKQTDIEPRVLTMDVANILKELVRPDDDDVGSSVSLEAEKANTSTRTVYRVLSESTATISLDLADRLCLAANSHLAACRLQHQDGTVAPYFGEDTGIIPL